MKPIVSTQYASIALFTALGLFYTVHAEDAPRFETHVLPVLQQRCAPCHFPGEKKVKSELDLSTLASTLAGGKNGVSIHPGAVDESRLVGMIEWRTDPFMPPNDKFKQIPQEEIELIKAWIAAGAPGDGGETSAITAAPVSVTEAPATAATLDAAPVSALAWSPDGAVLARGGLTTVSLFAAANGQLDTASRHELPGHAGQVRALAFSGDGTLLAAAGGKEARAGEVILWDTANRTPVRTLAGHSDMILDVAFSPDNATLVTCSYDKHVMLWNVADGALKHDLTDHVDAVFAVAFSADGRYLATGAGDRTVKLWDTAAGERLITFSDAEKAVNTVAFSPDGRYLAAGSADKRIYVWDVPASAEQFTQSATSTGVLAHSKFAHDGGVILLAYAPDGKSLFSTGEDNRIKIWDSAAMEERQTLEEQPDWLMDLAPSPDGAWLAAGRYDATLALYNAVDGARTYSSTDGAVVAASAAAPIEKTGRHNVDALFIEATIPPVIDSVQPVRTHRGSEVELIVEGKNLADAALYFNTGLPVELLSSEVREKPEFQYNEKNLGVQIHDNAMLYRLKLKVSIPADAAPGDHYLFAETSFGLAEPGKIMVALRPDVNEADLGEARALPALPVTVAGVLATQGEADRFTVNAAEGEEMVFALTDTAIVPSLRIVDGQGVVVASNAAHTGDNAARIGFRCATAGKYTLEVADTELRGGQGYRLHAGPFPWITRRFPLGVRGGAEHAVQVTGFNLGVNSVITFTPTAAGSASETMPLPVPDYPANPISSPHIAVSAFEERVETEPNDTVEHAHVAALGVAVSGHIDVAGDYDLYRFQAEPGRPVYIETMAARLDIAIDPVIEIVDATGQIAPRAVARCTSQTHITLLSRDSRSAGLRLDQWSSFAMNDYLMAGGEIIRVKKLPDYADEDVSFFSVGNQRLSFFGTSPQHHANLSPVYRVELFPPGAEFPSNGMPVFPIYWQNDDAVFNDALSSDAQLIFEAPAAGEYYVRVRDAEGQAAGVPYRIVFREAEPDYSISVSPYRMNVPAGAAVPVTVGIRRRDGFDAPVRLSAEGLPQGVRISEAVLLPGEESIDLELRAGADAVSSPRNAAYTLVARADSPAGPIERAAGFGEVTVVRQQPDLLVQADKPILELGSGATSALAVHLDRFNGFSSRVPIDVLNLPHGVYVLNTGLNGILVRGGEHDRTMEIYAEPWVAPMEREIYVKARIESPSTGRLVFISQPIRLRILATAK
ncbi:MAG: hypothetical protein HYV27_07875 [Candidatus Hydrogenedentes bacterium]|nr:hypothetical protein [Candidatus Hydrogenedentota bacterium]